MKSNTEELKNLFSLSRSAIISQTPNSLVSYSSQGDTANQLVLQLQATFRMKQTERSQLGLDKITDDKPCVSAERCVVCVELMLSLVDSVKKSVWSSTSNSRQAVYRHTQKKTQCRTGTQKGIHRDTLFGSRAFSIAGPTVWNSLPEDLHDPVNFNVKCKFI